MLDPIPLTGALGARIDGVDLSAPIDAPLADALRLAFADHIVLVIPGQSLSPAAQIDLTAVFGGAIEHPLRARRSLDGFPEVMVLENRPGRPGAPNDYWHSDISHMQTPPSATILHALEVPEARGDTMFCNMYRAYESLSEGMRALLLGLGAMHSGESTRRRNAAANDGLPVADVPSPSRHPVVRTHPVTGRRALFVNPRFTIGFEDMSAEESRPLLDFLVDHATRPENIYRHRWSPGDVVIWDNRCALHYAIRDYDDSMPRLMHRTTAAGDRPVG